MDAAVWPEGKGHPLFYFYHTGGIGSLPTVGHFHTWVPAFPTPSSALATRLATVAAVLGPLPHAALDWSKRKKQTTRLLKAQCECEYTVRIARTWVERVGPPHCPVHGPMAVEGFRATMTAGV
jgi:hypothetical protein